MKPNVENGIRVQCRRMPCYEILGKEEKQRMEAESYNTMCQKKKLAITINSKLSPQDHTVNDIVMKMHVQLTNMKVTFTYKDEDMHENESRHT